MEDKTLYQRMVQRYFQYRKDIGVPMSRKWNGWDGKALRKIMEYLLEVTEQDEKKAYLGWDYILSHIDRGTPFHQRVSLHLQTFHRYIPEVLAVLNPYGKLGKNKQQAARADREAYRRDLAQRLSRSADGSPQGDPPPKTT